MSASAIEKALVTVLGQQTHVFGQKLSKTSRIPRIPESPEHQRAILGDLLIGSNDDWDERTLAMIDQVWEKEQEERRRCGKILNWVQIPNRYTVKSEGMSGSSETQIGVWKGDITLLEIDAITNAANDQGLGCFAPKHRCVDNVIHRMAGPRLREACKESMMKRGYPLSAGTPPIVTDAFFLPSKHVIHITGPQISSYSKLVTEDDRQKLSTAYEESLNACVQNKIKSIAFCGISTGIFGFPKREACNIAVTTVLHWLEKNYGVLDAVIFDVFSEEEEMLYNEKLDNLLIKQKSTLTLR